MIFREVAESQMGFFYAGFKFLGQNQLCLPEHLSLRTSYLSMELLCLVNVCVISSETY